MKSRKSGVTPYASSSAALGCSSSAAPAAPPPMAVGSCNKVEERSSQHGHLAPKNLAHADGRLSTQRNTSRRTSVESKGACAYVVRSNPRGGYGHWASAAAPQNSQCSCMSACVHVLVGETFSAAACQRFEPPAGWLASRAAAAQPAGCARPPSSPPPPFPLE